MTGGDEGTTPDPVFAAAVAAATRDASDRHARWDAGTFAAVVRGPARDLWAGIKGQPFDDQTLAAYLGLLREAVAAGYVRGTAWATRAPAAAAPPWRSCLEYCLITAAPGDVPRLSPDARVTLLAKVWNLG